MSSISLQKSIIYGPILSRRLGRSLGVNILPVDEKVCSFDCIYCQYGYTESCMIDPPRKLMPSVGSILRTIENALKKPRTINYLTFSGNGEPSLHPDFPEIVQLTRELVNKIRPEAKVALFSNASLLTKPAVLETLGLIDLSMMKLDSGDSKTFQAINQPAISVKFGDVIRSLKSVPSLIIQSMLFDGEVNNIKGESYYQWVDALASLNPDAVHITSIERPTANDTLKSVSAKRLREIQEHLQVKLDSDVKVFWRD